MKLAVFGAGAIGGHLAARLARNGAEVAVIARGAQQAAIAARGLTIRAPDESFTVHPKVGTPADLGPQDLVLVTVKAPALASVAKSIAPLLGPATKVAFVLNGIPWWYLNETPIPPADPGDVVRTTIGLARTIGAVVHSACTVVEPGVISVANAKSRLVIGTPDDQHVPELAALKSALDQPGYECAIAPAIRDAVWSKLLGNLASGPTAVLTQSAPRDAFAEPAIQQAARASYAEGLAIAHALGCAPTHDIETATNALAKMHHRPSILQDLELGRPMEIDGIYNATLFLARRAGVPTPMLDTLVALMTLRARAAGLYPGTSV
jgi:2-dehydropantoate 2-reductase